MNTVSNLAYWPMRDDQQSESDRVVKVCGWNEWQIDAVKKILSFQSLNQPNWDSYGSRPMTDAVINAAIDFLDHISLENAPVPYVIPVSGGAIQFEWSKGNRELEVEIRPDGSILYLEAQNGVPLADEQLLEAVANAERLVSWVNSG